MKLHMKIIVALLLVGVGCSRKHQQASVAPAQTPDPKVEADGPDCLDAALVKDVRSHIALQIPDEPAFDRCDPKSHTYQMVETLILVKTMQYSESTQGEPFNQHILQGDFWDYFTKRATALAEDDDCRTGVLAYVRPFFDPGFPEHTVHVCKELFDPTHTKYERAETMLHEARHFEGFSHVTCSIGVRKGKAGACDDTIEEKGSYAVTVEVLTKMALNGKGIPHVQKTLLKTLALTYAGETFNTPVYNHDMAAFYLEGADKRAYIFSNKGLVNVASLGDAKLISRGATLAVFPNDKSDAFTVNVFSPNMDSAPAMGTFSAEYNRTPQAQRRDVVDIMNLGYITSSITAHQIKGQLLEQTEDTVVDFGYTIKAVFSGAEIGPKDTDSLYVLNDENELFRLQFLTGPTKYKMTQVPNTLGTMKQIIVFNGKRIGLDASGQIFVDNYGGWVPFEPLSSGLFTQVTRPFMWDQYFEDQEMVSNDLK